MTNFKLYTVTALMAGLIALPVAGANAEGNSGSAGTAAGGSATTGSTGGTSNTLGAQIGTSARTGNSGVGADVGVGVNAGTKRTTGTRTTNSTSATGTTGTSANAGASGALTSQAYSGYDTDRSGGLSEGEYKALNRADSFTTLDTNGDSHLSISELNNNRAAARTTTR